MHRRKFISTLGQAGLAAAGTFGSAGGAASAENRPRLRIGQIGTAHAHADGKMAVLRRSRDFEMVGVVEPDPELRRAAEARKDYQGVRWMTEEELLNTSGLRAVAVETRVKDLLPVATRCVAAGMHVHVDKPAGDSLPQFQRLLDQATQRKLTLQMGYMFRYNAGFELCFRAVREGWLGRIFSIEAVIGKLSAPAERANIARYRGGAMFELGCHVIDAVVTVLGQPTRVIAHGRAFRDSDPLLDNQLAVFEYPGALVTVRASVIEVDGTARRQFVVCGDAGTIDLCPLEPPAVRLALAAARGEFKKGYQDVRVPREPRYEADFVDLAKVIRGEKPFAWPPAHDLAVQETVLRASGMPV